MSRTQHLIRSSTLVIFIFSLDKITGFVKLLLMTRTFGTGPEADAFAAANQLPELLLAMLAGGAVAAALIPVYSSYLTTEQTQSAAALANTVMTLTMLVVGSVCGLAALYAPWVTRVVLAPHFSPAQQSLTAELMQTVLLAAVIIGVGGVLTSLLHAHQHFLTPALARVLIDLGQIGGIYFLAPRWGIHGVAWGSVIGAGLTVAVQIPALARHRIGFRPQLALRLAGVRELARLMWPRIITMGAFQAVDLVFIRLASQLPEGSISAYFYALLAMVYMPKSLFGSAIAQVIFPTLAEHYNAGAHAALKRTVTLGLRAAWTAILPASIGLLVLGRPAVAFLFQRGSFDAHSTALVYTLMAILSLRLVSEASQDILSLTFYARHNTRTPMWATVGWMALNVGLSYLWVGPFGIQGLAWAASLSASALALGLYALNHWVLDSLDGPLLASSLGRMLLACAGMGVLILALHRLGLATLPFLITAIGAGGLAFVVLYFLLGGQEVRSAWRLLRGSFA